MDQAYSSTLSALAGTVIGGVTSFATSWVTQSAQAKAARIAAERAKREELYGRFIDEIAVLYGQALASDQVEYAKLVPLFALKGRIILLASPQVTAAAESALKFAVDLYLAPARTAPEMRQMMEDRSADIIGAFSAECRRELETLRLR